MINFLSFFGQIVITFLKWLLIYSSFYLIWLDQAIICLIIRLAGEKSCVHRVSFSRKKDLKIQISLRQQNPMTTNVDLKLSCPCLLKFRKFANIKTSYFQQKHCNMNTIDKWAAALSFCYFTLDQRYFPATIHSSVSQFSTTIF